MVARPAWSGHLKLSLVTCPVALYKATEAAKRGVSFNYINPETNDRVRMKPSDASTGETVQRSDLVKGYAVDKGLYVTVTEDEIKALRLDSNGATQIERFCADADIDRIYWDQPYYLVPDGELANEPYAVIREAMREGGQVALARVVMNGRERQFALEVCGKGIIAHAIRTHKEVRPAANYFDRLPDTAPNDQMVSIARQILKQHAGPFDPTAFVDGYQAAVLALVERKKAEQGIIRQGAGAERSRPSEGEIVDLMAMLKASLGGTSAGARKPTRRRPAEPAPLPARRKAARARAG